MDENSGRTLRLTVVTPSGIAWQREASAIVLQTTDGQIQILPGHAPLVTLLEPGEMRIEFERRDELYAAGEGFAEILPNRVTVFSDLAEEAGTILHDATEAARLRAELALAEAARLTDDERLATELLIKECRVKLDIAMRGKRRKSMPESQ